MKFLKKVSLAASIAAVSVAANAEMVAMDEVSMSEATGQAGIKIQADIGNITVGEILYTDTDEGGALSLDTLSISGAQMDYEIDILGNGTLQIARTNTVSGMTLSLDSVDVQGTGGENTNLLSGLSLNMDLGTSLTSIYEVTGDDSLSDTVIDMDSSFKINSGSVTLLNGAIGVGSITFDDGLGGMVTTSTTITADEQGLGVALNAITGDLTLGSVTVGGASMGDLAISNLTMQDTTLLISGKD